MGASNAGESSQKLINQIYELFGAVEREIIRSGLDTVVSTPAINQLRYAGFHFIAAYKNGDGDWNQEELQKSISHCKRALSDTFYASGFYYIIIAKEIAEKLSDSLFTHICIPNYKEITFRLEHAREKLIQYSSQKQQDHFTSTINQQQLDDLSELIEPLKNDILILQANAPAILAMEQNRRDDINRSFKMNTVTAIVIAICSLILGAILNGTFFKTAFVWK
jgi:hypothetical protein